MSQHVQSDTEITDEFADATFTVEDRGKDRHSGYPEVLVEGTFPDAGDHVAGGSTTSVEYATYDPARRQYRLLPEHWYPSATLDDMRNAVKQYLKAKYGYSYRRVEWLVGTKPRVRRPRRVSVPARWR